MVFNLRSGVVSKMKRSLVSGPAPLDADASDSRSSGGISIGRNSDGKGSSMNHQSDTLTDEALLTIPSDSEIAIGSIEGMLVKPFRPFVFVHQVYQVVPNMTVVDAEIDSLRKRGVYRVLDCGYSVAGSIGSQVLIKNEVYRKDFFNTFGHLAEKADKLDSVLGQWTALEVKTLSKKFGVLISSYSQLSVLKSQLMCDNGADVSVMALFRKTTGGSSSSTGIAEEDGTASYEGRDWLPFSEKEINCLAHYSFLRTGEGGNANEVYWFSHPLLGTLFNYMRTSEKLLVSMVKRTKYKEVTESKIVGAGGWSQQQPVQASGTGASEQKKKRKLTSVGDAPYQLTNGTPFNNHYHLLDILARNKLAKIPGARPAEYIIRYI